MHSEAFCVYNKRTKIIEDSIHIVFDESNDSRLSSSSFQKLKLSIYDDDKEEEEVIAKSNMKYKEPHQDSNPGNKCLLQVKNHMP